VATIRTTPTVVLTLRGHRQETTAPAARGVAPRARDTNGRVQQPGKIEQALRELFEVEPPHPDQEAALREAEGAVIEVIARRRRWSWRRAIPICAGCSISSPMRTAYSRKASAAIPTARADPSGGRLKTAAAQSRPR
jgi:hypothetical protein